MEARILKLQEIAKNRRVLTTDFDQIRQESIRREEEKRRVEYIESQLKKIPHRFRGKTFSDYEAQTPEQIRVKILAERYVATFNDRLASGSSLVFYGKPGTGKTLLSLIMYQSLVNSGYSTHYESSLEFLKELLDAKFKSQTTFNSKLEAYQRNKFLIIDEATESISKDGAPSEVERQLFFQIINKRYEESLCTLIISNRTQSDITARFGQPTMDRLYEQGIAIGFNWNSYRQK